MKEIAVEIMKGSPLSQFYNEARMITRDLLLNLILWKYEMCPQIGYYVMNQENMNMLGHQDEWIEKKFKEISEVIRSKQILAFRLGFIP